MDVVSFTALRTALGAEVASVMGTADGGVPKRPHEILPKWFRTSRSFAKLSPGIMM